MRRPAFSTTSPAPRSARIGAKVTITLDGTGDISEKVLSGVVTDQPSNRRMAILLNGAGYIGFVRDYSPAFYRVLINDRIAIVNKSSVTLYLID